MANGTTTTTPPAVTRDQLVTNLVGMGLNQNQAGQAVDHVVSSLVFSKGGGLLADQNCNACGGGAQRQ